MDVYYVGILSTNASTILCDWVNWPEGFEADMRTRMFKTGGYSRLASSIAHLSTITGLWNKETTVCMLPEFSQATLTVLDPHLH
jgi:hypothetical protein